MGLSSKPIKKNFKRIAVIYAVTIIPIVIIWTPYLLSLVIMAPILLMGIEDLVQTKHAIRRNFPVLGRMRYMLEDIRPEIQQYFVEDETTGTPISREFRSLIYRRAKDVRETTPFGTTRDVYRDGYEFMAHSMYPVKELHDVRVTVGGPQCTRPYSSSLMNISAMSFGSLSKQAILALNKGAKLGGFAHNTGEGSISPYHREGEGDLIWQIGTGYFGCRTDEGNFNPVTFKEQATTSAVKMIEIKLSQGAKPGHGGILPAAKNTPEIAAIRHVEVGTDVHSPPYHTAFSDAKGLLMFVQELRNLSKGKPVGFKLCVGDESEFADIITAIKDTGIKPDFITVDGGEGGTGAAPVEFSNSLGVPLREGLSYVVDTLIAADLKKDIKVIASGKIFTGFHIARALALGADMVNSARGMMLSLGCIQARECNTNTCPVGIATQNQNLAVGLDVNDKYVRVANFQKKTVHAFLEMLGAAGLDSVDKLNRTHIRRRIGTKIKTYAEIY